MRVMIADDQPRVRSALRLLIEQEPGLELDGEVADAIGLLRRLGRSSPPELVLLDWELPGLSGEQLLRLIRHEDPDVRIVVLSGRPETHRPALSAGADAFVEKGNRASYLVEVLRELRSSRNRGRPES